MLSSCPLALSSLISFGDWRGLDLSVFASFPFGTFDPDTGLEVDVLSLVPIPAANWARMSSILDNLSSRALFCRSLFSLLFRDVDFFFSEFWVSFHRPQHIHNYHYLIVDN